MKRLLFLPLLALGSVALTGCFEDESRIYDGPMQAEFKPSTTAVSNSFYIRNLTNPAVASSPRADSVVVQLITGSAHTAPVTVNYEVDAASTAVSGTDYNITSTAGSVTFQPGQYSVPIKFNTLNDANPATTGSRTLIFNLMDTGDVKAAANLKRFELRIAR